MLLLPSLAALAACASPASPVPVTPTETTPSPSATPPMAATPAPRATPVQVSGVVPFTLPSGYVDFRVSADRRVRMVVSATTEGTGEHPARLTVGMRGAAAYRAPEAPVAWPYSETPRWHSASAGSSRQLSQAGGERAIGHTETFWVTTGSFEPSADQQRQAVLKRITPHAYFYVDPTSTKVGDDALAALATEFEARIYPRVTATFGAENRPGVDGEDRLFVVLTPAFSGTDLLGYFWARDAVPAAQAEAHANRKEVLFMSDRLLTAARLQRYGVLAHELQHLINFSRKGARLGFVSQEATWLDEGLAMIAMDLAGYGLHEGDQLVAKDIRAFQQAPEAYSLTDWGSNPNGKAFGQNYLFVRYVVDRFGAGILKELLDTPAIGVAALDTVLAPRGTTFAAVFREWAIANLYQGKGPAPYRYESVDLTGAYAGMSFPGFKTRVMADASLTLKPWGSAFFDGPEGLEAFRLEAVAAPLSGGVTAE